MSSFKHLAASCGLVLGSLTSIAPARTIYVHGTIGDDQWDGLCTTWDGGTCGPKKTIQAGIDVAINGDVVIVAPVTYTRDGNRDMDFLGKAITVRSLDPNDPVVVAWTLVDCEASEGDWHRGFTFANGEGRDSVLAGITIKNGAAPLNYSPPPIEGWAHEGGAISIKGSSPTIDRCVFINNQAFGGGGGAIISNGVTSPDDAGAPLIIGCTFIGNASRPYGNYCGAGGAIDCDGGQPVIADCIFSGNFRVCYFPSLLGGGALFLWRCEAVVRNCLMHGNHLLASPSCGGAVSSWASRVWLVNCVLSANADYTGGAGGSGGALYAGDDLAGGPGGSDVTLINCVVAGNQARHGGAFATDWGAPASRLRLVNCTIIGNRGECGSVLDWPSGSVDIANCIVWNGWDWLCSGLCDITYSDIDGGWSGVGNINADPLFVDPGHWNDNGTPNDPSDDWWTDGDYRLLPGSPCIDAASNAALPRDDFDLDADDCVTERLPVDLEWQARFHDDPATPDTGFGAAPLADMGAHEFGAGSPPVPGPCDGDLNCDGVVDFDDITPFVLALSDPAVYAAAYPDCNILNGDCNGDGLVDFDDINAFVALLSGAA